MEHAHATTPAPRSSRSGTVLTVGAVVVFIGFLVTIISAVLINALSPSVGALQVQQMQDALYAGLAIVLVGIILVVAGVYRPATPASPPH